MTPSQQKMADKMPESALQQAVEDRCDALGIRHWHDHDARMNRGGHPDLLLVGKVVAYAELKSMRGRLRPEQEKFMSDLEAAGANVLLWRPEHLFDGTIDRVLRQIAGK